MRPVIAVDLAARFSAGVTRSSGGEVVAQWDSGDMTPAEVAGRIAREYINAGGLLDQKPLVVIEDLPPHVPSSTVAKHVAQLQGRILQQFVVSVSAQALADVFFVPPAHWERDMGVWKCSPAEWASKAAELGYAAPDLLAARGLVRGTKGKATAIKEAEKQQTDYVAAFLISEWARRDMERGALWDSKIIKQYRS